MKPLPSIALAILGAVLLAGGWAVFTIGFAHGWLWLDAALGHPTVPRFLPLALFVAAIVVAFIVASLRRRGIIASRPSVPRSPID